LRQRIILRREELERATRLANGHRWWNHLEGQDTPVMLLDHSIIENGLVESLGE